MKKFEFKSETLREMFGDEFDHEKAVEEIISVVKESFAKSEINDNEVVCVGLAEGLTTLVETVAPLITDDVIKEGVDNFLSNLEERGITEEQLVDEFGSWVGTLPTYEEFTNK